MITSAPRLTICALAAAVITAGAAHAANVDLAAAKKEGKVTWYTSTPIKTAQKVAALFEKETGVHVELFRSGGSAILRRFMQEHTSGLNAADVMTTSDPANSNKLAAQGVFVPFKPDNFDKVPDVAKEPNGAWVAQRLNMMVIYVRSDKIAAADYPKTWTDVLAPKYKGKLAMTDPSFTSLQLMVVSTLSRKFGWDYYKKLKANGIMIVQSNQQVLDTVKSGERPIALGALDSYAAAARKQGHKISLDLSERRHFHHPVAHRHHQRIAAPQRRQVVRQLHAEQEGAGAVSGWRRLCCAHRHGSAGQQPALKRRQADAGRLRADPEGHGRGQERVQRDIPVAADARAEPESRRAVDERNAQRQGRGTLDRPRTAA